MKRKNLCGPRFGKLVHQFPGVITFAYDLCFRCTIAHWKGIVGEIHFGGSIRAFGYHWDARSWKTFIQALKMAPEVKTAKNSKLSENCFEPVGKGWWPPISIWINHPSLGRNGLHCIEVKLDEEISIEFGPGWATFLGAGAALLWKLDKVGSFVVEFPWLVCPQYAHWIHVACIWGWSFFVSTSLLSLRCPIMVGNMAEGQPRWRLDADQEMRGCWAQNNYQPRPWWWCTNHNRVG